MVCLALLPFKDQPAAIRGQRILEVQQRKEQYLWGQLPPGVTDLPGFIHAPKHKDLPKDAQFSNEKTRSFHHGRLHGVANLGLSYLYTLCDSWEDFNSFKKIFTGWTGDVPRIADNDLWLEDRMFGYQFLNGCNPCVIERCYELPSKFPVTDEMVQNVLDRGRTLEEEIKVNLKLVLSKRYWRNLRVVVSKEDYVFDACHSFQIALGIISFTVLRCKFEEIDAFVKSKSICPPLIKLSY